MRRGLALTALAIVAGGCSGATGDLADPTPTAAVPAPDSAPARLVVAIVYDQFPSWAYEKYRALLTPAGALRRTRARGADHVVELAYAGTSTAQGHAAIFTGLPPAGSGVGSNEAWSAERGMRSIVDDGVHDVFGLPGAFASPSVLTADSVADALRRTHGDRTRIVGLSYKDRGAVLTAGKDPDLALWYEKRIGVITSSTYYGETLPAWVDDWIARNPIRDRFVDWQPADSQMLQRLLGPDQAPGEGDYLGLGTTFPHNPDTTTDPGRTFRLMPQSTDHLLDLAREAIGQLDLGADGIPDLLVLSISSTDYVGHTFGPDSWEYLDHLIRIDAAVGEFLGEIEERTSVAVLITSDHGGAPLPERSRKSLPQAGRIFPDTLPQQLNAAAEEILGAGEWVGAYANPFVYLTPAARTPERRDRAVAAVLAALTAMPEVHSAFDVRTRFAAADELSEVERTVALSIPATLPGDIFVVPDRGSVNDEGMPRGAGTSHGTPWPFDRQVPALFAGPGVEHTSSTAPLDQSRVAATLCKLLGIAPPAAIAAVKPLPGI